MRIKLNSCGGTSTTSPFGDASVTFQGQPSGWRSAKYGGDTRLQIRHQPSPAAGGPGGGNVQVARRPGSRRHEVAARVSLDPRHPRHHGRWRVGTIGRHGAGRCGTPVSWRLRHDTAIPASLAGPAHQSSGADHRRLQAVREATQPTIEAALGPRREMGSNRWKRVAPSRSRDTRLSGRACGWQPQQPIHFGSGHGRLRPSQGWSPALGTTRGEPELPGHHASLAGAIWLRNRTHRK